MRRAPIVAAYEVLLSNGRLRPDPAQQALANSLGHLQQQFIEKRRPARGLYVYGGVGTGKSRIVDLFAATSLPELSQKCRRTHFFEFMTDIHTRLHRERALVSYTGDPLVKIGGQVNHESPILCLDEFQVSDIADAMILKRLFTSFWDQGGILISTSNRHPTELYKNGLNRGLFLPFIDELQHRCTVFKMDNAEDYRMTRKPIHTRDDVFFTDPALFSKELIAAANGQPFKSLEVPVIMNRKLSVEAFQPRNTSNMIVSATFNGLCERFLGSTDYHALCNVASTIYLSGLRQFAADEVDVVRRLITLVDIAYESRTRVLCQSTHTMLQTFKNIVMSQHSHEVVPEPIAQLQDLMVRGEGGSSSSHATTFIGTMEWSATGRKEASLAAGGAGETDVRFSVLRAISRLHEMASEEYAEAAF